MSAVESETAGAAGDVLVDPATTWLRGDGVEVAVIAHGARIAAVRAPDRDGHWAEIALGLADRAAYRADRAYLGACVGRFANRIAAGTFELDGLTHRVPTNEPRAALHGGAVGFDHADWLVDGPAPDTTAAGEHSLTLRHSSPAGDNGFPGAVEATTTYRVRGSELVVEHTATTDAPTVINMTNHTYWNLAGADLAAGGVAGHRVTLHASTFLPVDADLIPRTGPVPVAATPFDFRAPTAIGARLRCPHPQMLAAHGYDHTYVPDGEPDPDGLRRVALVLAPSSGRTLELRTDQPGVQFYTGNMLDGSLVLRGGVTARQGDAFCLEPQAFPNAPNRPDFPSSVLRPGQTYRSRSVFRFGVRPA